MPAAPLVDAPVLVFGYWTWLELVVPFALGLVMAGELGVFGPLFGTLGVLLAPRFRRLWEDQVLVHQCWGRGLTLALWCLEWPLGSRPAWRWPATPFERGLVAWWRP